MMRSYSPDRVEWGEWTQFFNRLCFCDWNFEECRRVFGEMDLLKWVITTSSKNTIWCSARRAWGRKMTVAGWRMNLGIPKYQLGKHQTLKLGSWETLAATEKARMTMSNDPIQILLNHNKQSTLLSLHSEQTWFNLERWCWDTLHHHWVWKPEGETLSDRVMNLKKGWKSVEPVIFALRPNHHVKHTKKVGRMLKVVNCVTQSEGMALGNHKVEDERECTEKVQFIRAKLPSGCKR